MVVENNEEKNKHMYTKKNLRKIARVEISIYGKGNIINVSKDVVRILGEPNHVCLRINKDMSSIAILPCDSTDVMSFRVPSKLLFDRHCAFRICSKQFVKGALSANGLDENFTYTIPGQYSEKQNAIIFNVRDFK